MKLHDIKHNINMLVFYDLHPSQTKDFTVLAPRTFRRGTHAREKKQASNVQNMLQLATTFVINVQNPSFWHI